jgi:hypothetical protein
MNLFVCGLRRSGTTILYDALREDSELECFYEPLREQDATIGGGSGARDDDAFAETRARRDAFRAEHYPDLQPELFNWGGPRAPELELDSGFPDYVSEFLGSLLAAAPNVAIKETRLHHKLGAVAQLDPEAVVVHLVRDPRAVTASMLLGRRRRVDIYPDADAFFTARTGRRLWSSRRISEAAMAIPSLGPLYLPHDLPDFLRPLIVWKVAFAASDEDGRRLFGDRYVLVRLEDLRANPARELGRIYGAMGRETPADVAGWATQNVRRDADVHLAEDPRWARAVALLRMGPQLERAGYGEIAGLEAPTQPLDLTPPKPRSRLAGLVGRARRRLG